MMARWKGSLAWCQWDNEVIKLPHRPYTPAPLVEATWNCPAMLKASMQLWVRVPVARSGEQCLVLPRTFPGCHRKQSRQSIFCYCRLGNFAQKCCQRGRCLVWCGICLNVSYQYHLHAQLWPVNPSGVDWNRMPYPWILLLERLNDRDVGFFGFILWPWSQPSEICARGGCLQIAFWSPEVWRKTPGARGNGWCMILYCQMQWIHLLLMCDWWYGAGHHNWCCSWLFSEVRWWWKSEEKPDAIGGNKIIGIIDHSPRCCCDHPAAIGLAPLPGQLASWEIFKGMHRRTCGTLREETWQKVSDADRKCSKTAQFKHHKLSVTKRKASFLSLACEHQTGGGIKLELWHMA